MTKKSVPQNVYLCPCCAGEFGELGLFDPPDLFDGSWELVELRFEDEFEPDQPETSRSRRNPAGNRKQRRAKRKRSR